MTDLPVARLREIDYDARREPATDRHCVHCQRDLSIDSFVRFGRVLMLDGGPIFTLHPDDVHDWQHRMLTVLLPGGSQPSRIDDMGWRPFGVGCARRHGLQWTIPEDPAEVRPRLLRAGRWRFGHMLIVQDANGRWSIMIGAARTAGDMIGWHTETLAEAVEQAREEMPAHPPGRGFRSATE